MDRPAPLVPPFPVVHDMSIPTPTPPATPPSPIATPPPRAVAVEGPVDWGGASQPVGLLRRSGPWIGRILVGLVGGVIVSLSLGLMVFVFGHVSGREFAPSHFRMRSFSFYEIPLLGVQVTPIRRWDITPDIARRLSYAGWVSRPNPPPQNWHLVSLSRGSTAVRLADAELLTRFLEYEPATASIDSRSWLSWSYAHPAVAKILWPQVQRLANEDLYLFIPELFAIARRADSPDAAARQIERYLKDELTSLANDLRDAGRAELAAEIRRQADAVPGPGGGPSSGR